LRLFFNPKSFLRGFIMRRSSIFVLALSLLAASALPAMADTINFVGTANYDDINPSTAGFYNLGANTLGAATGIFSVFPNGQGVGLEPIGFGANFVPSTSIFVGYLANLLDFTALSETNSYSGGFLNVTVDGTISLNGGPAIPVILLVSSQGPDLQYDATYSASLTTVPEPTSVALLGTGLLGFAGIVRRKFMA
jgi:PEP-CTERM motif